MDIDTLIKKLKDIKAMGFVPTVRAHDGGVGNTLEGLLGIKENNISLPDTGEIEIKAKRVDSSSMLTLMSKSPFPRGVNRSLFNQYSHIGDDKIRKLYTTIYGSKLNPLGFRVVIKKDKLVLKNTKGIEAYWLLKDLIEHLEIKANQTLLVYALTEGTKGTSDERFYYEEAYLLSGLSPNSIRTTLEEGKLKFDIRIGADRTGNKAGAYHDHGTAIRISKQDYLSLFSTKKRLL